MFTPPVSSASLDSPRSIESLLLEKAVNNISGFRELIDLASMSLNDTDPVCETLKKLDAYLQKAIDPSEFNAIQRQRDVSAAYLEIKRVVEEFVTEHGEHCGLDFLEELK